MWTFRWLELEKFQGQDRKKEITPAQYQTSDFSQPQQQVQKLLIKTITGWGLFFKDEYNMYKDKPFDR